jgi:tetratricopeptide (TPR) repeat protein
MHQAIALILVCLVLGTPAVAQRLTPAQHARAGWNALNSGKPDEAAAAFHEALRSEPREPSLLLGAGLAAHLLGRSDEARRYLVDALRYDPAFTPASLLLGELLYRATDLDGAILIYQQALTYQPDHRQLLAKLEAWRKEAALHDRFARKLSDHFTVLFEGPAEAELAAMVVDILERSYWRIGSALYTYPPDVITVVLYTREQFRDITQSPEWAGGAYDGRIRVPMLGAVKNVRELERVLAHELTHALVKTIAPRGVPQWLNEGLAMNYEGMDVTPHIERVRAAESRHALTALERSFSGMDSKAATLAYAQSAAAVKLLLDESGPPALVGILTDIARGLPFAEAFQRHTHLSYEEFQKRQ